MDKVLNLEVISYSPQFTIRARMKDGNVNMKAVN